MAVIDAARVAALVFSCSVHPDDSLINALVAVQSGGNTFFVGDSHALTMRDDFTSAAAALEHAERVRLAGGRPALGLLGLPMEWAEKLGYASVDLFDACKNIAIGSTFFAEFDHACVRRDSGPGRRRAHAPAFAPRRACVLRRFAAALGAQPVVTEVLAHLKRTPDPGTLSASFAAAPDESAFAPVQETGPSKTDASPAAPSSLPPPPVPPTSR